MPLSSLFIVLSGVIWALDGYVRQYIQLPTHFLIALEMTLAGSILFFASWIMTRKKFHAVQKVRAFFMTVILGGILGSWFFMQALRATDSLGLVFVLISLQPVFTILTSALVLGEHPKKSFYVFAATTVLASILLVAGDTGWVFDPAAFDAYVYAILTALAWGASTTFGKIVADNNEHLSYIVGLRFLSVAVVAWCVVGFLGIGQVSFIDIFSPANQLFWLIAFLVVVSNIGGYLFYMHGLRDMPAALATLLELSLPVTGFILDYAAHGITPSPLKVVAAVTLMMSIVILPHCHFLDSPVPHVSNS